MKIYTKTGDKGKTSLLGGTRVSKSHERINAYGTIDELNSFLGLVSDLDHNDERAKFIQNIQSRLFTIGSSLAAESDKAKEFKPDLEDNDVKDLELAIDGMNVSLAPMKNFILPGGNQLVSTTHIARTVCRRAERLIIKLSESEDIEEIITKYLNRLSDYLFVLARKQGYDLKVEEIPWRPKE
ncbi:MAG: cob(I)yrinic acid a,c-diamide adenosyltransferase [Cyclobacteriaceae bacterium]|nr:cob(I)yrinic acid a,c-diamide adenosyltransferase [Cyclobacteriaceae bacterium]